MVFLMKSLDFLFCFWYNISMGNFNVKKYDAVVIGAGAAGMMCAGTAAEFGCGKIALIEKNNIYGKKLLITGKGRCNVTNNCDVRTLVENTVRNGRFLYSAFSSFSSYDTMAFFEELGVQLKTERGNRVFPVSDKSSDITEAMKRYVSSKNIDHIKGDVVSLIIEDGELKGCRLADGRSIFAEKVVVATGGRSYPLTGSTGAGYILAEQAGHTVVPQKASIVPLEVEEREVCNALMGLSLRNISVTVVRGQKTVYTDFGELMFANYGVSGPVILSASAHVNDGDKIIIDMKPALDEKTLDKRILSDFSKYINKDFGNALGDLLPKKMIPVAVELSGIDHDLKVNSVTAVQRASLVRVLKKFTLTVKGKRPIEEAVVTSGGVAVNEIDPKRMESKILPGLYFAGEVIDADAYTGGFNLQIAFSTGRAAGKSIVY